MDLRYHPERQSLASNCVWRRRSIFLVEWLQCLTAFQCVNIISYVSLAVWNIPLGWKWTCYIISGAGYGLSGLLMAYVSPACSNKIHVLIYIIVGRMKFALMTTRSGLW